MKKKMNNKGFSLVELIIVIAIMVVLVALLAPQFLKFVEKSKKSTDMQNVDSLVSAIEVYAIDPDKDTTATDPDDPIGETVTITLNYGAAATVGGTPEDPGVLDALRHAGIEKADLALKYDKWTDSKNVVLTFKTDADGNISVSSDVAAGKDDILGGKKAAE